MEGFVTGSVGVTPGKALTGLRVVHEGTGTPIGVPAGLLRSLVLGVGTVPTFGLGLATVAWTVVADPRRERRGWHDQIASSVVVDIRPEPAPAPAGEERPRHVVNLTAMRLIPAEPTLPPRTQAQGQAQGPAGDVTIRSATGPLRPAPGPSVLLAPASAPPGTARREPLRPASTPGGVPGVGGAASSSPQSASVPGAPDRAVDAVDAAHGAAGSSVHRAVGDASHGASHGAEDRGGHRVGPGEAVAPPLGGASNEPSESLAPAPAVHSPPAGASTPHEGGRTVARTTRRAPATPGPHPVWRVVFDSGETFVVGGLTLIGRRPEARSGEVADRLVALPSPEMSVSKTHAQVTVASDGVLVLLDRGSTNGTVLHRKGIVKPVSPGKATTLLEDDRVRFGDREMTVIRES